MTYYKGISMQEIAFHLRMPLKGTSSELTKSFFALVIKPLILPFLLFLALYFLSQFWQVIVINKKDNKEWNISKLFLKFKKIIIWPFAIIVLLLSIDSLIINFRLDKYILSNLSKTDIYKKEYIDPSKIKFDFPEKKRNLVFIILESMESTFFQKDYGGYYNEDLISELRTLAKDNIHFTNTNLLGGAAQVAGTGWTVGALVAHTLGIPLILPIHGNNYEGYNKFLPGAYGLTDILASAGYQQRFLIGSDKRFAGRDTLFETHGNVLIKDINYYKANGKIPQNYHVWWGFEDEKLYNLAKEELLDLASQPEPFNLMLLTVDTHHVGGYVCRLCKNEFDLQYKNVLACASKQVSSFVSWIQSQEWYENTTIVIVGDHLYMDGTFVPYGADRRTYNVYINSQVQPKRTNFREFSTLDTFPSILDSLGVKYQEPGLALGRSLFRDSLTLLEKYGLQVLNEELPKNCKEYNYFLYYKR